MAWERGKKKEDGTWLMDHGEGEKDFPKGYSAREGSEAYGFESLFEDNQNH